MHSDDCVLHEVRIYTDNLCVAYVLMKSLIVPPPKPSLPRKAGKTLLTLDLGESVVAHFSVLALHGLIS